MPNIETPQQTTVSLSAAGEASPTAGPSDELILRIQHSVQIMHIAWGLAWLVGFGLLFLHDSPNDDEYVSLPDWLPLTTLLVLLAAAGLTTAVQGVKVFGRGAADDRTARQAKWYGTAWLLGFVGLMLTMGKITGDLPDDVKGLLWGATTTGLVGALHMAGSAIWGDRAQLRTGIWVTFINVVGVMAGAGWQSLIISIAGGALSIFLGARGLLRIKNAV